MENSSHDDSNIRGESSGSACRHAAIGQAHALHNLQRLVELFRPDHVPVRRDDAVMARNFPDQDIAVSSPAFEWPHTVPPEFHQGTETATDERCFYQFIDMIEKRHDWIHHHKADFFSEEGRRFCYILLSETRSNIKIQTSPVSKLRIWLQGGVHGNEPAGDQSLLALLGKMNTDSSWTSQILEKMDIMIFPRYNPDGIADFNRGCANGLDLNRDHVRLATPQTAKIRQIFCEFAPHVAVDMHEFSATARYGKYIHGSDAMLSAAKNLNIHSNIREMSEDLFIQGIIRKLEERNLRWEPYLPMRGASDSFGEAGSDGQIGRNAMGLTQCVSLLCEIRGIGIADQYFHRRVVTGLTFLEAVIQTATDNAESILSTIEESIEDFVNNKNDIVIKDAPIMTERVLKLIEAKTGKLVHVPFKLRSTTPTIPVLTRSRPEAYLMSASLSNIASLLTESGLELQQLDQGCHRIVEVLTIADVVFGQTYFEGVVPIRVITKSETIDKFFGSGTYVVSTRQKNAALAFIALEPENVDSYVSLDILPVEVGQEYKIYRQMAPCSET